MRRLPPHCRDELSAAVRLYTSPLYAEHIVAGPQGRVAPGTNRPQILMPPGKYTVRLTVDSAMQSQPLEVRKDPNSAGTDAEIAEQTRVSARSWRSSTKGQQRWRVWRTSACSCNRCSVSLRLMRTC